MRRIYLDHAAATPTHPDVLEAMLPCLTETSGDPSRVYSCGQEARAVPKRPEPRWQSLLAPMRGRLLSPAGERKRIVSP